MVRTTRRRFEQLVAEALRRIPPEFQRALDNIEVAIEAWPTDEQLAAVGLESDELLFGLYQGTPLPERSPLEPYRLPDIITIFQGPLEEACASEDEMREEIRKTVVHELAHYFGLDEDRLEELGFG
ncbi:MAG: metallopeptidase family protein [Armatimonadota bacterium]|nr:metallopeptidase family protein [Armatimonadota bacterium]MDR7485694.1 metallopeptidase family protein [Armatimonadota bacterium]MDR7533087.1 metallopeptidase family protein [Armatimonadota bacterium]MDR7535881.1 metallopeptidase family protein [Armatimonadota bacterium]